jgi:hypothetical protein
MLGFYRFPGVMTRAVERDDCRLLESSDHPRKYPLANLVARRKQISIMSDASSVASELSSDLGWTE